MTMTDPIADMLTRLRNANTAMHDDVSMPSSTLKESLANVLKSEGYIADFSIEENSGQPGRKLNIILKYSPDRKRVISGIQRVSKPGLRVYRKSTEIQRVLGGLGIAVLSTSQGLMTDREARKRHVGGEVLCEVW
jgi:small subunit ribosomal protein S8